MRTQRLVDRLDSGIFGGRRIQAWSVFASESRRHSIGAKDRQIGGMHSPEQLSESAGARYLVVWDDGQISRGTLERRQVELDPDAALAAARASAYEDPDSAQVLGPHDYPDVDLHDPGVAAIACGTADLFHSRLADLQQRFDDSDLRTWSASFSASDVDGAVVTSAGLEVHSSGTTCGWHATIDGEIGDGYSARKAECESEFQARVERLLAINRSLRVRTTDLEAGRRLVILHPRVVEAFVLDTLLHHLDGSQVAHGESRFRHEQFGDPSAVLREDISLTLEPLTPMRAGSYRFTSEGVPAARCRFIEGGRLIQPLLDLKYARRLSRAPTPLSNGPDSLRFSGREELSFDDALAEASALVLGVLGVHTQDAASGDFSLAAPQTLTVRGGRLGARCRTTIAGNLFQLLCDPELRFVRFEGETTPGLGVVCRLDPA